MNVPSTAGELAGLLLTVVVVGALTLGFALLSPAARTRRRRRRARQRSHGPVLRFGGGPWPDLPVQRAALEDVSLPGPRSVGGGR